MALERRTLKAQERVLGPDHPHALQSAYDLAVCQSSLGRHEEAEALREEVCKRPKRQAGSM